MNKATVGLGLMLAMLTPSAFAQPARAQAEVLFREGRELMASGKLVEACAAFDASQKLDPALSTLLNQADCREKNGQLATAWGHFIEAERQTRTATDAETRRLNKLAGDRARKLEPRLSTLTIRVKGTTRVDGLEIRRDGDVIDVGALDKALPIDGGTYTISARAPGHADWKMSVTVGGQRDARTIDVPALESTIPGTASGSRAPAAVAGATSIVLLGTALGFDLWARSLYSDAKAEMSDQARRDSLYDSANTRRYLADGLALAGVGCAGLTVWLLLRQRDRESPVSARHAIVVSPTGVAIIGAF